MGLFSLIPSSAKRKAADAAFDKFDKDNSGQLDKSELDLAIGQVMGLLGKSGTKIPSGLTSMVLKKLDKDKSGTVSREEFAALVDLALGEMDKEEDKGKPV